MTIHQHPAAPPHAPAVMAILDRFNRDELGHAIEVLIALLDIWDGDPDDKQTNDAEDEALSGQAMRYADKGPGCIASDSPGDQAYVEWLTMRGSQKRGPNILAGHEDDEDDDSDAGVEDGPFDPEEDYGIEDVSHDWRGHTQRPRYGIDQTKGPLPQGVDLLS